MPREIVLTGVLTTGVYCLPWCRARRPNPENVRLYRGAAEARAAGLRPCKRCRPDEFLAGRDPDAERLDGVVAAARAEPARFRGVEDLCARAGFGATKLNRLFRERYHRTPAGFLSRARVAAACRTLAANGTAKSIEAGYAVGFETLSAYHQNFRRRTGMTPGAYRELGSSDEFVVGLPRDFRWEAPRGWLGRDPESPAERVDGTAMAKTVRLDEGPALLVIEGANGVARCRVEGARGGAAMRHAHGVATRLLGLDQDPGAFERKAARTPPYGCLVSGRRGLRVPLAASVFEALAWAVIGQQINLAFACALRRALLELCGEPLGEGWRAHPTPEAVAALEPADLARRRFSRAKAEALVGAARSFVAAGEDPEDLAHEAAPVVEDRLRSLRGIGPWTAQYVLLRGAGFADCVPVGDTGLGEALRRLHGLPERPAPAESRALLEPVAPHRSLATLHLWTWLGAAE